MRLTLKSLAFVALLAACSGGGRQYWLYPEPHLPPSEGAVFISFEGHQVQSVDGEETFSRCWGFAREPQAYSRRDIPCRLHLQPGEHYVSFRTGASTAQLRTVRFVAQPGKEYGLDWSACGSSPQGVAQTCEVRVIEVGGVG